MPSLRVVKKGVNRRCATSGAMPGPRSTDAELDPARVRPARTRDAQHALRPAAWCRPPSPGCRCAPGSAAPARPSCGRTARAAAAPAASSSTRAPLLRACRRTSGSTASISGRRRDRLARLLAPAHEVVHALDHPAGALGLLGDALRRPGAASPCGRRASLRGRRRACRFSEPAGVAGDRGQRLVQLVAQQRGHLADGRQPRGGLQPLLLLARQLLDAALRR